MQVKPGTLTVVATIEATLTPSAVAACAEFEHPTALVDQAAQAARDAFVSTLTTAGVDLATVDGITVDGATSISGSVVVTSGDES